MEDGDKTDIVIEDSDSFFGGKQGGIGIKEIAMANFNRACLEGSKEMIKGGIQRKLQGNHVIEVDAPNQREVFINSVKMVEVILLGHLQESKLKDKNGKVDDAISKCNTEYEIKVKEIKGTEKQISNSTLGKRTIDPSTYRNLYDAFELKVVDLYREKLALLGLLLKELNYFGEFDA